MIAKDGSAMPVQDRLGMDLEVKLKPELGTFIPYLRGEVAVIGHDLSFPGMDQERYLSIGGGGGMKFELYEGKKVKVALDAQCGDGSSVGRYCSAGVEFQW